MKFSLSTEAHIFFTKHGWIELEIEHVAPKGVDERDLWRTSSALKTFLTKQLAQVALALTGKKQLMLGCDQFFDKEHLPKTSCRLKDLLSVQGLALAVAISPEPVQLPRRTELGIIPVPSTKERVLFFRPDLILDFPHAGSDLYLAVYVLPTSVYVQNPKDTHTNSLKKFGYQFGDVLKNEFHPLIIA